MQFPFGSLHIGYGDDGVGPPVMCLHSGGFSSRQWKRLRDALAPRFRVITPDLIGYASSTRWPAGEPFHYQHDVDAMVALARSLGEPVFLVGHSYGGFLACHAALALGTVRGLALYDPVTFSVLDPARDADALANFAMKTTWEPDNDAWFRWFVDWWNGPGAWDALPKETADAFRDRGEKLFHEVRTLAADTTGAAGFRAITAPALVMTGSRTPLAEQRTVERLVEAMPHATMRRFDGMGHMGPITHHAIVDAAIAEFLTGVASRP